MNKTKKGHYMNVVNFDQLIGICKSYHLLYKPINTNYSISSLEMLSANIKSILANVSLQEITYAKDTNERELMFNDLKRLSTRVLLAAKSAGVTTLHFNDLVSVNRKIQGRRAVAITAEEKVILAKQADKTNTDPESVALKKNNVSQLSYDRLYNNFSKLIGVLKETPEYLPNEDELKLVSLEAKLDSMGLCNEKVSSSTLNLAKARFERDNLMYLQENNLVDTALAVKNYTRSVFGARSLQNKQLIKLLFSKLNK